MEHSALRDPHDTAYALARGSWASDIVHQTKVVEPATRAAAGAARRALETHFGGVLDPPHLHAVQLVVTELATNVVLHSGSSEVVVHAAVAPDVARVEVADSGPGFDPAAVSSREGGGFGLMLIARLASRWGTAVDDGACVWVEIDL